MPIDEKLPTSCPVESIVSVCQVCAGAPLIRKHTNSVLDKMAMTNFGRRTTRLVRGFAINLMTDFSHPLCGACGQWTCRDPGSISGRSNKGRGQDLLPKIFRKPAAATASFANPEPAVGDLSCFATNEAGGHLRLPTEPVRWFFLPREGTSPLNRSTPPR